MSNYSCQVLFLILGKLADTILSPLLPSLVNCDRDIRHLRRKFSWVTKIMLALLCNAVVLECKAEDLVSVRKDGMKKSLQK